MTLSKAIRFVIALAIMAGFINAAYPGNPEGLWYYDSRIYLQQGFNVRGNRPPVYPVFLGLVGNHVVGYQITLAVISWCLLGYLLAGFPGLIVLGVFAISPWFGRWHGNCLTESVSHSFAALVLSFSILLVRKPLWVFPWALSVCLFIMTRFTNALYLPFGVWPALLIRPRMRWLVVACLALLGYAAMRGLGAKERELVRDKGSPSAVKVLGDLGAYRQAWAWMTDSRTRPWWAGRPMSEDLREYRPRLSAASDRLEWLKPSYYGWGWLILLGVACADIAVRRRVTVLSLLIISLFVFCYAASLNHVFCDEILSENSEVWRHLSICDCGLVFSIAATLGMLRPRERGETNQARNSALGWIVVVAGMILFVAVVYTPGRFNPGDPEKALEKSIVESRDPLSTAIGQI